MARIFTDGAEMGDTLFFTSGTATAVSSPAPVVGVYSYSAGESLVKAFDSGLSELYFRARVRMYNGLTAAAIAFRNNTTNQYVLSFNQAFSRLDLTGAVSGNTGSGSVQASTWTLVEVHIKIDATVGAVAVRLDGHEVFSYTGNTLGAYSSTVDNILFAGGYATLLLDDLALNDTTGGADDTWCGDGYVEVLTPDGNGDQSDLVGSDADSTDNYLLVDEIPSDGDTTYNESGTAGNYDLYNLTAFDGTNKDIRRVFVEARVKSTGSAGDECKLILKTGGTIYKSDAIDLPAAYVRRVGSDYTTNPGTAAAWTDAQLDLLQAGIEVV